MNPAILKHRAVAACVSIVCACGFAHAQPPAAPAAAPATKLPRILVLATGGTIAGKATDISAIGYQSGQVSAKDLIDAVPGVEKMATLQAEQVSNIGSQDMNDEVWFKLARRINEVLAKGDTDGVVITHGTDTLEETAFFLEQVLASDKPVVLVGSMRPSTAVSADGPANLYEAVKVASAPSSQGRGVLVVLNDTIHESRDVTKTNTTSVQTFASPNSGPAGYVDPASVRFVLPLEKPQRPRFQLPEKAPLPRVDIIYSHANMTADSIEDAVKGGAKGLVLAGVGDGNSSKAAIDALVTAAKKGVLVVRSSRVPTGFTNRNAEVNDDQMGFATSMDLNPQKARILLQLLISANVKDIKKVQEAFETR